MQSDTKQTQHQPGNAAVYVRAAVAAGSSAADRESAARAYCEKDGLTLATVLRDHVSGRTPLHERSGGSGATRRDRWRRRATRDYVRRVAAVPR